MPRRSTARHSSSSSDGASAPSSVLDSLETLLSSGPLPSLAVFDLDYTLWPLWVDTHVDSPLKRRGEALNKVHDRNGQPLSFFPHVSPILFGLRRHRVQIAAASRTSAPSVAKQALNGLFLRDDFGSKGGANEPIKSISLFDFMEIYPGSKISHFRQLHKDSGVAYEDMIFFDDEYRNSEVGTKLGVQFVEVGHSGLDEATFEKGIREWRARKAARENGAGAASAAAL